IVRLCSPERSPIACWKVCWSMGRTYLRSAFDATEVYASWSRGVHKLSPGILTCDYCWAERDNSTTGVRADDLGLRATVWRCRKACGAKKGCSTVTRFGPPEAVQG